MQIATKGKREIKSKKDLKTKTKIEKINKDIIKYVDEELNSLSYILALQYDKRTYFQYYRSLLKTKHNFIFTFCNNNDYNSNIIKIDLFFISFIIYLSVNILFYNDDTMHQIYKTKGKFDIEYQIPKILYSSLISIVLNTLLKILALSNNDIIEFKKDKIKENNENRKKKLINKLKIKFILYFIISSIVLLFMSYYISIFCSIYRNTQIHLLKDTMISFFLSLLYPLLIYLLPGLFRIPSLSNPKNKREYMYKFSKILQIL